MEVSLARWVGYLFGTGSVLVSLVFSWVGTMAIRTGTHVGGATLLGVGLLFLFAGVVALPPSRQWLHTRVDIELSGMMTVLLSGGAVGLAVVILFAAFIELLASG